MQTLTMTKIWDGNVTGSDRYLTFKGKFAAGDGKTVLYVACDSVFTCRINGRIVAFGACQNYPFAIPYRTFDVTDEAKRGGELEITVWHQGLDSQTGMNLDAFVAFRLAAGGVTLLESGKNVLCAVVTGYENGRCKRITSQLGYGYAYDLTREGKEVFAPATEYGEVTAYEWEIDREKADQVLLPPAPTTLTKTDFGYSSDLGKETVGYLHFEADCDRETELTITYGEHLRDGRVARIIGDRDFSVTIKCRKGKNVFDGLFRRFAGRYIEAVGEGATVTSLTLIPVERAVTKKVRKFDDGDFQKIYDVSVYTLLCSMHDHYEDCPWREQALYTLDSRNQMLCGYYAFEGFAFQRQNLLLIAKGLYDGLLTLCFPMRGGNHAIPFFSLIYPVQVAEYIRYSGDKEILAEVGDVIKTIMKTFSARVESNGLIASFPYPYWNFYEWSDGSGNDADLSRTESDPFVKRYDTILSSAYVLAARACDELFGTTTDAEATVRGIREVLFDDNRGVYPLGSADSRSSVLCNAIAILAGAGDEKLAEKIVSDDTLIPVTLSMNTYFYDALLSFGDKYRDFILADVKRKYLHMLDKGATTFWETELGAADFDGAGSLCHGWSAIPVYYLCRLSGQEE